MKRFPKFIVVLTVAFVMSLAFVGCVINIGDNNIGGNNQAPNNTNNGNNNNNNNNGGSNDIVEFDFKQVFEIVLMCMPVYADIDGIEVKNDDIFRINTYNAFFAFLDLHTPDNMPIPNPVAYLLQIYTPQFFEAASLIVFGAWFDVKVDSISQEGVINIPRAPPSCCFDYICEPLLAPPPIAVFITIDKNFNPPDWSFNFKTVYPDWWFPYCLGCFADDLFDSYTLVLVPFVHGQWVYGHVELYTVFEENGELIFLIENSYSSAAAGDAITYYLFAAIIPNEVFNNFTVAKSRIFYTYTIEWQDCHYDHGIEIYKNCREWLQDINRVEHRAGLFPYQSVLYWGGIQVITSVDELNVFVGMDSLT